MESYHRINRNVLIQTNIMAHIIVENSPILTFEYKPIIDKYWNKGDALPLLFSAFFFNVE